MVLSKPLPMKMEMLMSPQGKFAIFCAEQYKLRRNLTGRQLTSLFERYDVWDYLFSCYEALHTTGTNYIIADIDQYIQERQTEPVIN